MHPFGSDYHYEVLSNNFFPLTCDFLCATTNCRKAKIMICIFYWFMI